ncbi:MAG TPA: tRNA (adenosine(37)-N6)-threonylcarbamoyltransferase complex ATPase subunit type 1 TsaE [Firmicutes bacterium]|nr:tRNA (adenosine(37)-N6)-threonylcarbamoyltransferase complex ATPase subunit type 1 TsaE [Bacillota bacterium]
MDSQILGEHLLPTSADTQALGERIGRSLKGGEVILCRASMGVGKTCLAQGIARGMGVTRVVNSPTFNMIKVYRGKPLIFYHVDAYRLENASENRDIGLWDLLRDPDGAVYIEWPEYIRGELKGVGEALSIELTILPDGKRKAIVKNVRI